MMAFFLQEEGVVHKAGQRGNCRDMVDVETYHFDLSYAPDKEFSHLSCWVKGGALVWELRILEDFLLSIG